MALGRTAGMLAVVAPRIVVVAALLSGTAFLTVAEYALVTARRWRMEGLAGAGDRRAVRALQLLADPLRFITTIQLGISALAILLGAVGEPLVRDLVRPPLSAGLSFALAIGTMTYLNVVVSDLVPKALALQRAERMALHVAPAIRLLEVAAYPIVWLLQASATAVLHPLGLHSPRPRVLVRSEQDLRGIVEEAEQTGVIEEAEEEMLYSVFDFAEAEARDVMVPRPRIDALSADLTLGQALQAVMDSPYTRHPVYRGDLDHVIGQLHLRDLFTAHYAGADHGGSIEPLLRPVPIIPDTKDVGALLGELRAGNQHMAVVVDEYGVTVGIITLEDLLEELVGEIADEYDLPDESIRWLDDRTVRVAGTFPIDDFNERFGDVLPQDGVHTLAGLVFGRLGRAPVVGDGLELPGLRLRVVAIDGPRIRALDVRFPAPPRQG
jgi:putative hemolysin